MSYKLSKKNPHTQQQERGLVILDIDGTLIDTVSGNNPRPKGKKRILQFEDHSIYGRPYAKSFVRWCLNKYDVGVWTFATWDYAIAVLTEGLGINPADLKFIYTRDRPPPFKKTHDMSVKQITRIPTAHQRRILIDDNLHNVITNEKDRLTPHSRALKIKEYKVHRPEATGDAELLKIKNLIKDRLGY